MKKNLFLLAVITFLSTISSWAQSYSTGTIILDEPNNYTAKIDIDENEVTLTLVGPADSWLGIGFTGACMGNGSDGIIFQPADTEGNELDRQFSGVGSLPSVDTNQDWSIESNTEDTDLRTLVVKRNISTANDSNDFQFSASTDPIDLIWAIGASEVAGRSNPDGSTHRRNGTASANNVTLGIQELFAAEFGMYPNPTVNKVEINLPQSIRKGFVFVTDQNGKIVLTSKIKRSRKILNLGNLPTGMYFLNFETLFGNITKKIVKN